MLRLQWQPGSDVTLRDATATELTNVAGMLDAPQTTSSSDSPAVRHLHGLVTATAAANPYYEHHMPEFRKEVMAGWHMFGHFCVVWKVTPLETSNYGCLKLAGMDIDMLHTSRGKPGPDYTERVPRCVCLGLDYDGLWRPGAGFFGPVLAEAHKTEESGRMMLHHHGEFISGIAQLDDLQDICQRAGDKVVTWIESLVTAVAPYVYVNRKRTPRDRP
eukprot:jgi/Tetstr1/454770/TSEL_041653.t1